MIQRAPHQDPRRIVEEGFDRIARRHAGWADLTRTEERARYLSVLLDRLPAGARVLELGCGAGGHVTREPASRFRLTAVDLPARSIEIARGVVPGAESLHGDMTRVVFPPDSFDGVVAFYSVIHARREDQDDLLARIATWLRWFVELGNPFTMADADLDPRVTAGTETGGRECVRCS